MLEKVRTVFREQRIFFFAVPALVWQISLCVVPLLFVITTSFLDKVTHKLTFANYLDIFDAAHVKIIGWSLLLAVTTSIICLLVGYPIAYWLARRVRLFKNFFIFLLIVPFWSNLLILIYSWIFILERSGLFNGLLMRIGLIADPLPLLNTVTAIVLVTFYCYLPFMVLPIYSALEKIDYHVLEASADLGASTFQTFFNIIVPLSWHGIRTGLLLVFVPVFGEFTIPLLMGGDKYMFMGNALSHYVFIALDLPKGAALTVVASISLIITLVIMISLVRFVMYRLQR